MTAQCDRTDPSHFDFAQGDKKVDAVYSDLVYVKRKLGFGDRRLEVVNDSRSKKPSTNNRPLSSYSLLRYWKAGDPSTGFRMTKWLRMGWMPPHPTLFVRKEVFTKYGLYRTDMKISADYEMILRLFYKHKITTNYLLQTTYCMTIGGASNKSIGNIITKSREDYRAMKMHGLTFPFITLMCKNFRKLPQFISKQ